MSIETLILENGEIHQLAMNIDRVINVFEYIRPDPGAAHRPASVIRVCTNQLKKISPRQTMGLVKIGRRINSEQ